VAVVKIEIIVSRGNPGVLHHTLVATGDVEDKDILKAMALKFAPLEAIEESVEEQSFGPAYASIRARWITLKGHSTICRTGDGGKKLAKKFAEQRRM
jgi:hypothetical protein